MPSGRRIADENGGTDEASSPNAYSISGPPPPQQNVGITADQATAILQNLQNLTQLLTQAVPNARVIRPGAQGERREENADNRQYSSARESRRTRRRAILGSEEEEEERRSRHTERSRRPGSRRSRSRSRRLDYGGEELPFDEYILEEPLPQKFKLPVLEHFDGMSDSRDHIFAYRTKMTIQEATDSLLCRAFPTTLRGPARDWFQSLRPGSITSFSRLTEKFEAHFVSSKRRTKNSTHLSTVRQKSDEGLRDYVGRFNKEALQVHDLNQQTAVNAFMLGLRKCQFRYSLFKDPAQTLSELLRRV